jgi:hypothetical protein
MMGMPFILPLPCGEGPPEGRGWGSGAFNRALFTPIRLAALATFPARGKDDNGKASIE